MLRECHGHSERTAAAPGLFQIGEQRVHHLHDGPSRQSWPHGTPGHAVQDVGGYGGHRGGGASDCVHYGAFRLPEHVHITGRTLYAALRALGVFTERSATSCAAGRSTAQVLTRFTNP